MAEVEEMLLGLIQPPYKVLCRSAHDVGKTHGAAVAVNWWYDTRNPGVAITTAPTKRDVEDLLWTEVRLQRQRGRYPGTDDHLSMDFIGPSAPCMRTSEEHYAKGYTAQRGESFAGRHRPRMLFIFDEASGVPATYWQTLKTMFDPELGHAVLIIFNPVDSSSQAYIEDTRMDVGEPSWHRFRLNALEHPNVRADLAGLPRPIPGAVNKAMVDQWVADWCDQVQAGDQQATDLEWPPGSGQWWKPGPIFQARALGLWPESGMGVWSDALWQSAVRAVLEPAPTDFPEIGCDVARFGDDYTSIHVRCGPVSLHHETHNGWDTVRTAGRLKELARQFSPKKYDPRRIPVKVDDDGVGGGVVDLADGYRFLAVNAGSTPYQPGDYPNKRSELWFVVREMARTGRLSVRLLDRASLSRLQQQVIAPTWKLDPSGRRYVEPKDMTKKRLGRSPDDADAFSLAYYPVLALEPAQGIEPAPVAPSLRPNRVVDAGLPGTVDRDARPVRPRRLADRILPRR